MDSIPHSRAAAGPGRATGVGVLDRCVSLLGLLADGPRSLRQLADASLLPRPTAHRLLVALEAHRLVARTGTGAFRLGPAGRRGRDYQCEESEMDPHHFLSTYIDYIIQTNRHL